MQYKKLKILSTIVLILTIILSISINPKPHDLVSISNNTYYYQNGLPQKGLITINNNKYYFNDATATLETGFIRTSKGIYYANSNGALNTGLTKINNNYYYFNEKTNLLETGLIIVNQNTIYYANDLGILQK